MASSFIIDESLGQTPTYIVAVALATILPSERPAMFTTTPHVAITSFRARWTPPCQGNFQGRRLRTITPRSCEKRRDRVNLQLCLQAVRYTPRGVLSDVPFPSIWYSAYFVCFRTLLMLLTCRTLQTTPKQASKTCRQSFPICSFDFQHKT